jgi:hypothetical protein
MILHRESKGKGSGHLGHLAPNSRPTVGLSTVSQQILFALLTPRQVAEQTNYQSPVSVLRAFRRGELPGYKLNARTIRFDPADVKAWIAAARVTGRRGAE